MLIDTHAHINMLKNPEMAIIEAKDAGVDKIIIPAAEACDFEEIISLAQRFEDVYCALGIHPEYADDFSDEIAKKIVDLAKNTKKVVAIGECGLDYHYSKENKASQKNMFITHIEIAKMLDLPLIVHDRDAHLDTLETLVQNKAQKVLLHCFSGSTEFMKQCTKLGYKIAIGGVVTFKNAKEIKEVAKEINIEDLMLETDCPYLTPHPFRGMENSPKYIGFIAKEIANIKNLTLDEVMHKTSINAIEFFNLQDS